jgi:hypothetical protein
MSEIFFGHRIRIEPDLENSGPNALLHVGKEGTVIQVMRKPTGEMNPMIVRLDEGRAMEFGIRDFVVTD